ncbi:hypothetical protein OBBRIDRAFT_808635 [Obba rivulosa]|uniref:Uncharacterized protein n=1 Tax=Obba rivulosa TaxID=1052685 RepID=A0A8E2AKD6_9APHY|nr:hypothetical protein OBBRIDRAFT_808635 [Obba rivulosa]
MLPLPLSPIKLPSPQLSFIRLFAAADTTAPVRSCNNSWSLKCWAMMPVNEAGVLRKCQECEHAKSAPIFQGLDLYRFNIPRQPVLRLETTKHGLDVAYRCIDEHTTDAFATSRAGGVRCFFSALLRVTTRLGCIKLALGSASYARATAVEQLPGDHDSRDHREGSHPPGKIVRAILVSILSKRQPFPISRDDIMGAAMMDLLDEDDVLQPVIDATWN